ncbi:hypothetical protein CUMW_256800 [Citrus unshiu]|uniref:Protein kinase domain-containing protein n=1 Tax=Citrus unshiu TaxID=55188 RepID=A0A2H5QS89_CITUN|nr:hypothetical protein CUMW_256800 [Citrus unshiu]
MEVYHLTLLSIFQTLKSLASFSIPNSLSNASNLQLLDLFRNQFNGKVSIDFSSLKILLMLNLEQNKLGMGTANDLDFATFLTNCSSLKVLSLTVNQFRGELSHPRANLSSTMIQFRIGGNQISGTVPPGIRNLVNLIALTMELNQLYMFRNFLEGSIPSGVGNLTKLASLDLGSNILQGNIPSSLGNCQNLNMFNAYQNNLEYLDISINSFHGITPLSLGFLKSIKELSVSRNNLSGRIPKFLKNLSFLEFLNLSYNHFKGEVSTKGAFSNKYKILLQGNEKLCGGIDELHLPSYPSKASRKPKIILLKVFIPILVSCLLLSSCLTIVYARKRTYAHKSIDTPPMEKHFLTVFYAELSKATCKFSPSNMISQGIFGFVYEGILGEDEMIVAIKVINLKQKEAFRSFVAECEALRNILLCAECGIKRTK